MFEEFLSGATKLCCTIPCCALLVHGDARILFSKNLFKQKLCGPSAAWRSFRPFGWFVCCLARKYCNLLHRSHLPLQIADRTWPSTARTLEIAGRACPNAVGVLEMIAQACPGTASSLKTTARGCPGAARALEMAAPPCPNAARALEIAAQASRGSVDPRKYRPDD